MSWSENYNFYTTVTENFLNQYVKSANFTSRKKNSNKLTHDLMLESYENKDLDVFGRCTWVKTYKFFSKLLFSVMNIQFLRQFWFTNKSRCFTKWLFWKKLQNSQESTCSGVSSSIKLQSSGLQIYWKRDSGTVGFLSILPNF